jgi:hypothetical protein
MLSSRQTQAPAPIPRCQHTGVTLPECSCRACLHAMLERVGFAVPEPVRTSSSK